MFENLKLDPESGSPLYRQLFIQFKDLIAHGGLKNGDRLPPTRDLAGSLGVNRATVSAAYALLESEGLIRGHVGRGSFVLTPSESNGKPGLNWPELLAPSEGGEPAPAGVPAGISFATSRPAEELFPLEDFRLSCDEVLGGPNAASILQLGSPAGYAPLRQHLIEAGRREGVASAGDDVIVTNGCQQALDLIRRVLVQPGDAVAIEDPVYPGLKNLFLHSDAQVHGVPVGVNGLDIDALERIAAKTKLRLIVATSQFQNPTGATLPLAARRSLLRIARASGAVVVENDIYGELRYEGEAVPSLKQLDETGGTVLLRSFSKITFPGLRVGWAIGPQPLIARLAEAKQLADLHSDQLSQAVLLRFAESGRLAAHRLRVLAAGRERRDAVISACEAYLPPGSAFTRPQGGMNLWVRLPEPLDAGELLARAQREGVSYLPGRFFAVSRQERGSLRLSFADVPPEKIRAGLAILGKIFSDELARARREHYQPAPAMV
jgi:DNA-binding transcriptional MocR family regulator